MENNEQVLSALSDTLVDFAKAKFAEAGLDNKVGIAFAIFDTEGGSIATLGGTISVPTLIEACKHLLSFTMDSLHKEDPEGLARFMANDLQDMVKQIKGGVGKPSHPLNAQWMKHGRQL